MALSVQSTRVQPMRLSVSAASWMFALVDIALIVVALLVSEFLYSGAVVGGQASPKDLVVLGIGMGAVFAAQIAMRGGYSLRALRDYRKQFAFAAVAWLLLFFLMGWLAFLTKTTGTASRVSIVIFFAGGFLIVGFGRALFAMAMRKAIAESRIIVRSAFVIAAREPGRRDALTRELARSGIEIVGMADIDLAGSAGDAERLRSEIARAVEGACSALTTQTYDAVHLYVPWRNAEAIAELQRAVVSCAVPVVLFADDFIDDIIRAPIFDTGHHVGFELKRSPLTLLERSIKRGFDILVSASLLTLLSPLMVMVAIGIAVESGRPIIFRQKRKGFGGRPFEIYKFRTMTVTENGDTIKQAERNDSRFTAFGAVLRRTSIDELPQLFNVLRGDMSLIGPRPHALAHDNFYVTLIEDYAYRQHVKPGLTGWAQVNGCRGETKTVDAMAARVEHDLWYIDHWSILLDIRIILRTVGIILFDRNAY
jgi:Undecaprenyl-phosphate glucose phosphotransferase